MKTENILAPGKQNGSAESINHAGEIHVYAGTGGHSAWFSDDVGMTWVHPNSHSGISVDVHGIAVTRTRTGASRVLATTNRGLHVSDDNGEIWKFAQLDSPWQYTRAVVTRADDPSIVFLANGNGPPGNDGRLLRSHDAGDSWRALELPGPLNSSVWCIATHPSNPFLIFACTNLGQLFRSTDGGDTWSRLPHEFGEVRSLHWRTVPPGTRRAPHATTLRVPSHQPASAD